MNRFRGRTVWGISLLMLLSILDAPISADSEGKRHQRRERRHSEDNHHGDKNLKPVTNSIYAEKCGACHYAYQPELLPNKSWRRILDGIDDHFGETVDLDPDAKAEIVDYLESNAANSSSAALARKILRCLDGQAPLRITNISCIRKEHNEISPQVIKRPSVGSWSNCIACHRTAAKGVYDDDWVSIPE